MAGKKIASTCGKRKISKVMKEFSHGSLRSSSGHRVSSSSQARAIAMSSARRHCRRKR